MKVLHARANYVRNYFSDRGRESYRLRLGGYRGIYKIEGEQVMVLVLDVGPRGGIYT